MSNIYFMCENCGIETNGITFVNGMKFCAKCYHQIFGKDNQQTEITQLKQQLAEKDKEIAHLKEKDNYRLRYELAGADETITNLKKQLEEKDKEIERLKVFEKAYYFNLSSVSKEYIKLMLQNAYQKPNQSQLAIQELEKVKDKIEKRNNGTNNANYSIQYKNGYSSCCCDIEEQVDQQIKELKGE